MSVGEKKDRAKSWVWVVVNPWIDILDFELSRLGSRQVSWRWRSRRLERLKPLRNQMIHGAGLLLDDLSREKPAVRVWEQEHDGGLAEIENHAAATFDALLGDGVFRAELGDRLGRDRGLLEWAIRDASDSDATNEFGELCVNFAPALSNEHGAAAFWTRHRDVLLAARERLGGPLDGAIARQKQRAEAHKELLVALRWEFVDAYDIPAHPVGA